MDNGRGATAKEIVKDTANILSAFLAAAAAFLFCALSFNYKFIPFIEENYALLMWLAGGASLVLALAYVMLFVFEKKAAYRLVFCVLICLDVMAVAFYMLCKTGAINKITSIEALRSYIGGFGSAAIIIFVVFQFLQVVVLPVPGSVSVAAGVALFGPFKCAVFSFIGIVLGSIVAFEIGRLIGYRAVSWIVGKEDLDKWLNKIKGKDYLILSIMFLLPLFPDDMLCFVAGLSSMSRPFFLVTITVTRLISVFTTAYSFELIPFNTWWGLTAWAFLAAAIGIVFWLVLKYADNIDAYLKRKFHKKSGGDAE